MVLKTRVPDKKSESSESELKKEEDREKMGPGLRDPVDEKANVQDGAKAPQQKKADEPEISRATDVQKDIPDEETEKVLGNDNPTAGGGAFKLMIDSILENLKIVIAGSQSIELGSLHELVDIDKATAKIPKVVDKVATEIRLVEDADGEWCIMQGRIRHSSEGWSNYEEFLKTYRHIVEEGVKEMYSIYKLRDDDYVNTIRVMKPEVVGFEKDPRSMKNVTARNVVYNHAQAFQIIPDGQHNDSVARATNPVLADIILETQRWLLDNDEHSHAIRRWVALFIRK